MAEVEAKAEEEGSMMKVGLVHVNVFPVPAMFSSLRSPLFIPSRDAEY